MFLAYSDLIQLFPKSKGIKDDLQFYTVSTNSSFTQQRGLFIPMYEDSGELKEAIQNGAIGAIWDEQSKLPDYIPNHFPVFYVRNLKEAIEKILNTYADKLNGEKNENMNMTYFLFDEEKLLKNSLPSYDKPVLKFGQKTERRG
jgi:hypothetical protein